MSLNQACRPERGRSPDVDTIGVDRDLEARCPFRKSGASFSPCFLAWLQVVCAAKLAG
jgi:hypothetical protein